METKIINFLKMASGVLELTLNKVSNKFDFENTLPNRSIEDILNNKEDQKKIEEAIQYLKDHQDQKSQEIIFSDNEKLTVSIT